MSAARGGGGFGGEGRAVGEDGVDLPALAARGALHPELVLLRVAAGRAALVDRREAEGGQPGLLGIDVAGGADLDPEVVERAALTGVLQQDELQRRVRDREVGV